MNRALAALVLVLASLAATSQTQEADALVFQTEVIVEGLTDPSDIVFLDQTTALVSQRPKGVISLVDITTGKMSDLTGMPPMYKSQYVGVHNMALHPDYQNNGWIYMSYSVGDEHRSTTAVDRFRLDGKRVQDRERILTANQFAETPVHYGARLALHGRYLFVSMGDRRHRDRAQEKDNHAGSILRLFDDGSVPPDNPFVGQEGVAAEIWSFGHRNPQGLAFDVETGELWSTEHGPRGGDELNQIEAGNNYGWPEISFGMEYDGGPVGKGVTISEGMQQPVWVWVPSIAPSGLIRYRGAQFPQWQGDFFTGSLAFAHLNRVKMRNGQVVLEERLLFGTYGRVRAVAEAPDGAIFIATDSGHLVRLSAK